MISAHERPSTKRCAIYNEVMADTVALTAELLHGADRAAERGERAFTRDRAVTDTGSDDDREGAEGVDELAVEHGVLLLGG